MRASGCILASFNAWRSIYTAERCWMWVLVVDGPPLNPFVMVLDWSTLLNPLPAYCVSWSKNWVILRANNRSFPLRGASMLSRCRIIVLILRSLALLLLRLQSRAVNQAWPKCCVSPGLEAKSCLSGLVVKTMHGCARTVFAISHYL